MLSPTNLVADPSDPKNQKKLSRTVNLWHWRVTSTVLWLFFIVCFVQFLIVFLSRIPPLRSLNRTTNSTATVVSAVSPPITTAISSAVVSNMTQPELRPPLPTEECPYGRVYVYDIPSRFNKGLLPKNCRNASPYSWQCDVATNHGFGGLATELPGIVPENLLHSWYRTNQFSLEVIFHHRILHYKCRTGNPQSAGAFYVPFYGGLAVEKHLWINDLSKRDRRCKMILKWLKNRKPWRKSNGSDHFLTLGRVTWDFRRGPAPNSWGSAFFNMPEMRHVTRLTIEKSPWDPLDLSVPYPTGFHPTTLPAGTQWQDFVRRRNRTRLFTFTGATRPGNKDNFRGILRGHCLNETDSCWLVDCAVVQCVRNSSETMKALLGSEFCLQPVGDSFTRKSVFDCMVAGSVPVFFWTGTAYEQYEGFLPAKRSSYSVFIDEREVRSGTSPVKEVLMKYGKEEIGRMREKAIDSIPRIIYGDRKGGVMDFEDGYDFAIDMVLQRIRGERNNHV